MNFIKEIFEGDQKKAHNQFIRFSKGFFEQKAGLNLRKGTKVKVSTSYELANDLVILVLNLSNKVNISGIILSREDISKNLSSNNIKAISEEKKGGLFYKNNIEKQEVESKKLIKIIENSYYSLLDIDAEGLKLKIKQKLPNTKGKFNDKFCNLEADLKFWDKIQEDLFFDLNKNIKKAKIIHDYDIKKIIIPTELKKETDFKKIRENALREGILTRKITADGAVKEIKKEFVA